MSFAFRPIASCTLVAASLACTLPADAAEVAMRLAATAANTCQPALPAFEGQIRKRPLSVQNEGSSPAFLTCAMAAASTATRSGLYANSIDGQPHTISCTIVLGFITGAPLYVTKSVDVPASGGQVSMQVVPFDVSRVVDLNTQFVSYSCQLPPGSGINDMWVTWLQGVGD